MGRFSFGAFCDERGTDDKNDVSKKRERERERERKREKEREKKKEEEFVLKNMLFFERACLGYVLV